MDVTPPQAPPALESGPQQEAVDALGRLVDVQAWLAAQQRDTPALPASPAADGLEAWLSSLDAFWRRPVEDAPGAVPVPRVDALATRLATTMRDEAIVRRLDGTLDAVAASVAERFARTLDGDAPPGMDVRSLRIGKADYAGAVIVSDRNHPTSVLRFMPDRGWDVFASLNQLHAHTEVLLRQEIARRRQLPGVRADDTEQVIANDRFVDSEPLTTDVFRSIARRIVAVQREKVEDAWPSADEGAQAGQAPRFTDEATSALDLYDKLDVIAVLIEREQRLAVALNEHRLARVPADVAQAWRDAVAGHRHARLVAAASARQFTGDAPLTLAAWCRKELVGALSRRRIDVDPDDVDVEISGDGDLTLSRPGSSHATPPMRVSLAEFALRNTGRIEAHRLRVVIATGSASRPGLDLDAVRGMARELDLTPRFGAYLREMVSDPRGRRFRFNTMRLQQARMRVAAAEARMGTYLRDEAAQFLDDREERGYRMIEAVLDSPAAATRRTVGDHRVTVRQLVYRGAVVSDVLVIGVRDPRSSSRVVLYTPGAPDGRQFREFSDRSSASREFLYAPAFQEYLLHRLPVEYGEPAPNRSGRRFRVAEATRRAHWVLAAPRDGRGTITEEPFEERIVDGDVRTAMFDAEIVRQTRDVAWVGRSTAQADVDAIVGVAREVLGAPRGAAAWIEETAGAVAHALDATWRFYDSVKAGDSNQAFVDFAEAYVASLGVAGGYPGALRAARPRPSLRPRDTGLRGTDAGIRLTDARQLLDLRYATLGVDLAGLRADILGVHRLGGRRYIRQQEAVFEVRYDTPTGTWRLARPNALDAAVPGPAVEPTLAGGWRLRTGTGLRGGWVDDAAFPQARTRGIDGQDVEGLTAFQRWTFGQSLAERLRNGGEANRLYWDATSQPGLRYVTLRQRTAWNDALRVARHTPPEPLPVGASPGPGASWRVLPQTEWPAQLWHYPGAGVAATSNGPVVLTLEALPGSGLTGLRVTTEAPSSSTGLAWIRLHLDRYRGRLGTPESPGITIIEVRRGSESTYVVQPAMGFPIGYLGLEVGDFTAGWQVAAAPALGRLR